MDIYTLNVGQGQFVVVAGETEAFVVDTYVPLEPKFPILNVKGALADILSGKQLIGLMVTGFDADHFNEVGLRIVLNKYRPNWLMYPKYFKQSSNADRCFNVITDFTGKSPLKKIPVSLDKLDHRFFNKISEEFKFEVFSPHVDDMNSSNNCSLVCKVTERSTGGSYLVTGDTEGDRWDSIVRYFGEHLESDLLAAPHHGSRNGITEEAIAAINPTTVVVSAGVANKFGHPHVDAMTLFEDYAKDWYMTCDRNGISLRTSITRSTVRTFEF